jgi:hypothetical protein
VEWLSWKLIELGSALPKGWGVGSSWQDGEFGFLVPGWWLSQRGEAPVIPHGAGAGVRQGLMSVGNPRSRGPIVPR